MTARATASTTAATKRCSPAFDVLFFPLASLFTFLTLFVGNWFDSIKATGELGGLYPNQKACEGYRARVWANENVGEPRQIIGISRGQVIVLDRLNARVLLLRDVNDDGHISNENEAGEMVVLVTKEGINHGVAIDFEGKFLFASDPRNVYRWPIEIDDELKMIAERPITSECTIVIESMSEDSVDAVSGSTAYGHSTRTIVISTKLDEMYIQVGSIGNVDSNPYRAGIRRVDMSRLRTTISEPIDYRTLTYLANGVRNTVGLAIDPLNEMQMFGVDNGPDRMERNGLDVHSNNPGEEVNVFDLSKSDVFYGYPYCASEYDLGTDEAIGKKAQFMWTGPNRDFSATHSDEWCRNTTNNKPPEVVDFGHSAYLGITFFNCSSALPFSGNGTFDCEDHHGDAFVAYHGSWNRIPATGYKVTKMKMEGVGTTRKLTGEIMNVLWNEGTYAPKWPTGFRPVSTAFESIHGKLLISSDSSGEIVILEKVNSEEANSTSSGGTSSQPIVTIVISVIMSSVFFT
jgi:hypothetical protein